MKKQNLLVLASLLTLGLITGCSDRKGANTSTSNASVNPATSEVAPTSSETKASSSEVAAESSVKPVVTVTGVTISGAAETLEAKEELQLSATVVLSSGTDTLGVTWSTSNENVATVDENGKVVALSVSADTQVTITATSKKDSSKSQSVTITVLKDEDKSLFGEKANMTNGDQDASVANVGTFIEWHDQNWCGGSVTIHEAYTEGNTFKLTYEATDGTPWYGMQLFYKNAELVAGTPYKLSLKLTSSLACAITVNGTVVNLVEGENTVDVKYIEAANKASLGIQMGVDGVSTVLGATITGEVTGWTDISGDKTALSAPTNVAIANGDSQGLYVLSFDAVENAAGYMYSIKNASGEAIEALSYKKCETGAVIDLREYDTAKYSVVVQAIGDGLEYSDSATSTAVEIDHAKPEAREAVTYRANYGDEVIDLAFGEAAKAGATPTFWNDQNWCGSNCVIDYAFAKGDQIQVKFSGGTIDYSFQLFVNQAGVNAGSQYTLKMNIWSDVAGTINLNGQDVTLVVGDNIVAVAYTASSVDQYNNPIASGITLKNSKVAAAELKISNIRWTEVIAGVEDTDVGTACEEPAILKAVATKINAPAGVVYNANGTMAWGAVDNAASYKVTVYSDAACATETTIKDVALGNGAALDVSSLEAGTYYAKVFAVAADGTVSEGSTAVEIKVSAAGIAAPVGVVYNSDGTMAWGAVTGADSYVVTVYSDEACTTETAIKNVALGNGGKLDVSSLEAGEYYAKVFAVKGENLSDGSSAVKITIAAPVDPDDPVDPVDPVEGTDYTVTLSSGVGGAWLNMTITFNGKDALTMENVDLSSAKITLASGNVLKATGKVGVETIDAKKLKVGIGFPSAEFVAGQDHTFEVIITVGEKAYKLTEVFTGEANSSDKVFTIKSQSIEETVVEAKVEPTVAGEATVLEQGASKTRFEGAGAFVWIDAASVGYDGTNWASMSATAKVEMYDAGNVKTGITCNNVNLQEPTASYFCAYVVCSGAPVDGWTTTIELTIVVGDKAYKCTAQFNGTAYVVKGVEEADV